MHTTGHTTRSDHPVDANCRPPAHESGSLLYRSIRQLSAAVRGLGARWRYNRSTIAS